MLKILKAFYGSFNLIKSDDIVIDGLKIDVTEILNNKITNNNLSFTVSNELFSDPAPNYIKKLWIRYQFNDVIFENTIFENYFCQIPEISKIKKITDVDIIIPFRNNSDLRLNNLKYVIKYYKKFLPSANIIIVEQDTLTDFKELNKLIYKHLIINLNENLFCRSFLLNEGYNNSHAKYLILSDCDCIISKEILLNIEEYYDLFDKYYIIPYKIVHYLSSEQSDLVKNNFLTELKIENFKKDPETYSWTFTKGGVNIVSSKNFYKVGGFNTNFIGWGGEDEEICERFKLSNIEIKNLFFDLFHLRHEFNTQHQNDKYSNDDINEKRKMIPLIRIYNHDQY